MPRKRPLELRLKEAEEKLDRLKLEETIRQLRARIPSKRRRRKTLRLL